MNHGCVYVWSPDASHPLGGRLDKEIVPLADLTRDAEGSVHLSGRMVRVRNDGWVKLFDPLIGTAREIAIGDARPDSNGDFLFEAGRGGGRMDKAALAEEDFCWRYIQASHFGEVNSYYHLHKIAAYIDDLLNELGVPSLPLVTAVINAHQGKAGHGDTGEAASDARQSLSFQGGHYRLPSQRYNMPEPYPIAPDGEIHLGPGRQLLDAGALVEAAGVRYRANASHNAGILYHEYGHHITRHTADFRANRLRPSDRQDNRKIALDEGTCDYWAAAMLGPPHIWAWHKRHDGEQIHPRSLASAKTMDDFDYSPKADPHANGTIWAAALWDLRARLKNEDDDGARKADLLVLKSLLLIGEGFGSEPAIQEVRRSRSSYAGALAKLLRADELLYAGRFRRTILACFSARKIFPAPESCGDLASAAGLRSTPVLLKHVGLEEIPSSEDILSGEQLQNYVQALDEPRFSLIAAGDIMLGDRSMRPIRERGSDYPFQGVLPLLNRSEIVLGNLEGPFAKEAKREERNFSYRVDPRLALSLARANINVVTLANNHLMDCGREGVLETLTALADAGIHAVGAGADEDAARGPAVLNAGSLRVGILGYYWNRRCAATRELPGSAMNTRDHLEADICALREKVDRIVVTFHWGIPYERTPLPEDEAKARFAIDCGADLVVAHHPHVIQRFEIYNGCPIFYSVGNFAFGSGNSRAEGIMVGVRFEPSETVVRIYPLYVKNRDPRIHYQPKVLRGSASEKVLRRLAEVSGASGCAVNVETVGGTLRLMRACKKEVHQ